MPTTAAVAYPDAQANRAGPPNTALVTTPSATLQPPRSRHFSIEGGSQANSRTTISTPRLLGPIIIQNLIWKHRVAADPPNHSLELGWATVPITETQVALTTPKSWNAIMTKLRTPYEVPVLNAIGMTQVTIAGLGPLEQLGAPILIAEAELYLTISFLNYGGLNPNSAWVELSLLESVAPEVAATFH